MEHLQTELSRFLQIIVGAVINISTIYAAIYAKKWFDYIKEKISLIKDERARKIVENALTVINSLI